MLLLALYFAVPILITVLVEVEYFGWSTLALLASGGGLYFLHSKETLEFVRNYGIWVPAYVAAYVGAGVLWSFVKWWSYLMNFRRAFRQARDRFLASRLAGAPYQADELKAYFRSHLREFGKYGSAIVDFKVPQAQDNKGRIVAWIGFWPLSILGTVLNDPIRRLCALSFNWLRGLYQRLSNRIFREDTELQ